MGFVPLYNFLSRFLIIWAIFLANLLTAYSQNKFCPFQRKNILPGVLQNEADLCFPIQNQCNPNNLYYSYDGSCNNLIFTHWAQKGTAFVRLLRANYSDDVSKIRTSTDGSPLPLASVIRKVLLTNADIYSNRLNIFFTSFGQFLDHDVSHQRQIESPDNCCIDGKPALIQNPNICLPLIFAPNDPFYSKYGITCLDLKRATSTQLLGCPIKPVFQINYETGYIDLSILYGTSVPRVLQLRTLTAGLLKTSNDATTNFQEFPIISFGLKNCPVGGVTPLPGGACFLSGVYDGNIRYSAFGDARINQNPELLIADTVFLRLHNYLAKNLKLFNPYWTDEQLYQMARRINIAIYQHSVSAEYLPTLLGPGTVSLYGLYPSGTVYASGYSPLINAQTMMSYAAAAGRSGHSTIAGKVALKGPIGLPETYTLRNKYFNNKFVLGKNMFLNIIEAYTKQPSEKQDQHFTDNVNDWLFESIGAPYGQDLATIDILRGRDFGLADYNSYRVACGLCRLKTFEELAAEIKNPEDVIKLRMLYKNVNDIDLYVGGLLEKPLLGSTIGPTFSCIIGESFHRWKYGDRLYYEFWQAGFTPAQLQAIKTTTVAGVLCLTNPRLIAVPKNAFLMPSAQNPLVLCSQITKLNLISWKSITF